MEHLNKNDRTILKAWLRHPAKSHRKLSKIVGLSQPTVTRRTHSLLKRNVMKYAVIPDFSKLGYELIAIAKIPVLGPDTEDEIKLENQLLNEQGIVYALRTIDGYRIVLSLHKNYSMFFHFCRKFTVESSFVAPADEGVAKQFDFSKLL